MIKSSKKAFTLVELIVVVVILGILALVAVPSFTRVIGGTRDATLEQTARTIAANANAQAMLNPGADAGVTTEENIQKAALESGLTASAVPDGNGYTLTNKSVGVELSLDKNGKKETVCIKVTPASEQPDRAKVTTVGVPC